MKNGNNPTLWIEDIFDAKAARCGGVLKRKIDSVTKHASEKQLIEGARRRGFHVKKGQTHYLIICSDPAWLIDIC